MTEKLESIFMNQEFKYFSQRYHLMCIFIDEQLHLFWFLAHFPRVHNQKPHWIM